MGNKKATGFLCLRLVPCFAYVGAEDNRKGIPFVKIVSLLCKLIQFLMVALSVTVHKALILLVFLNHPYQSLAFSNLSGAFKLFFDHSSSILESDFLVVTGTVSQFGEVYFPLRPLCVFDYNENCCQNDVTASSRPLRIESFDFFNGWPIASAISS